MWERVLAKLLKGKQNMKIYWANVRPITFKANQSDFLPSVEPVSDSLSLPLGARGDIQTCHHHIA